MDQSQFDSLTRRTSAALSRRAGVLAVVGGLLGLAALDSPDAGATRKAQRRRKRARRHDRRDRPARTTLPCSKDEPCPDGMNCLELGGRGQCICANSGLPACGTTCCPQGVACCDGVCCGADQTCKRKGDTSYCACKTDGRPACDGICCDDGDACFGNRCKRCSGRLEKCASDDQCCSGFRCCLHEGVCDTRCGGSGGNG